MLEGKTVIKNPTGLHARPAAQLVKYCGKFASRISLASDSGEADPKSIFSLLRGGFTMGTTVTVRTEGEDEDEALKGVIGFIDALEE